MGILRKVFSKGMQAWNAGYRPGVAQHQWGMGRLKFGLKLIPEAIIKMKTLL